MVNQLPGPDKGLLDVLFSKQTEVAANTPEKNAPTNEFAAMLEAKQDQKIMPGREQNTLEIAKFLGAKNVSPAIPSEDVIASSLKMPTEQKMESKEIEKNLNKLVSKTEELEKGSSKKVKENSEEKKSSDIAQALAVSMSSLQGDKKVSEPIREGESALDQKKSELLKKTTIGKSSGKEKIEIPQDIETGKLADLKSKIPAIQNPKLKEINTPKAKDVRASDFAQTDLAQVELPKAGDHVQVGLDTQSKSMTKLNSKVSGDQALKAGVFPSSEQYVKDRSQAQSLSVDSKQGSILGVSRPDPRLVGNVAEKNESESQGKENKGDEKSSLGFNLSQTPMSEKNGVDFKNSITSFNPVAGSSSAHAARIDATNTMQLASQINYLANQGGGALKVKLTPENLGEMTITVTQSKGKSLDVRFEASNHEAQALLMNSREDLRSVLENSKFKVDGIGVEMAAQSNSAPQSLTSSVSDVIAMDRMRMDWMNQHSSNQDFSGDSNRRQEQQGQSNPWQRFNDGSGRNGGQERGAERGYKQYYDMQWGA